MVFMYIIQAILLLKSSLQSNLYLCPYDLSRIKRIHSSFSLTAFLSISHCMSNIFLHIFISYITFTIITSRLWIKLQQSVK